MDGIKSAVRRWPLSIVFPSQALPKAPVYYQPGPEDGSHSLLLMENNSTLRSLMFLIHRTPHCKSPGIPAHLLFSAPCTPRETHSREHTRRSVRVHLRLHRHIHRLTHRHTHTHAHTYTHTHNHLLQVGDRNQRNSLERINVLYFYD